MEFESIDKEPDNMEPSTIPKQFEWRGSGRGPSRVTPPDISLHNVDGPLYTVHVLRVGHNPQNFNSKHTYPAPYAHHQVADGVTRAKLERSMSVREPVKCTITLITGRDIGPILVDPGDTWDRAWLLQELHALHIDPLNVQYVIGTHGHADHIGVSLLSV